MEQILLSFVQDLLKNNTIPVHCITLPCEDYSWLDFGLRSTILENHDHEFIRSYLDKLNENTIYYLKDTLHCIYTILRIPDSSGLMICGPVLLEEMPPDRLKEVSRKMKIPERQQPVLQGFYLRLTCFPSPTVYNNIFLTLGNYLFGENQYEIIFNDFNDMDSWYETYAHYSNTEDSRMNIRMIEERYGIENQILDAVASGNETRALNIISSLTGRNLPYRLPCSLRDSKDYAISFNTLLRKTVEQAGVHPIHIDAHSNQNVKLIEQSSSKAQCSAIQLQLVRNYCRMVRKYTLRDYSLLTRKVMTWISTDLTLDLSLNAMAELLNVNASYLSTLFKREVGIPLTDYVNRQRVELAKKLLVATDFPIKIIAEKCGVPDVYYFSRMFKKRTGCTPKVYREQAGREQGP
ncbi:hypothetical protein C805_00965 [Eubacterium sp. 14-2]|uniref:helix-turn-helix domain-containing protein n=1 Tax=Eubacterium sp. 14-2 TaxID=1235790 RepID=UPI00033E0293|nr:helix-turn-helix domain-containing protein [Eubacterium sp. 14-2]EOT26863.1 hypothetical protein C805_00965 [Eubacterium sp. 14-2]